MAITYTYAVNAVRVGPQGGLTDVVKEVDANVVGVDGAATFTLSTTVKLSEADPAAFTVFADLTEAQVISWIEADPSLENIKAHIAYVVGKELEKLALEQKPLPWAPEPVPADA